MTRGYTDAQGIYHDQGAAKQFSWADWDKDHGTAASAHEQHIGRVMKPEEKTAFKTGFQAGVSGKMGTPDYPSQHPLFPHAEAGRSAGAALMGGSAPGHDTGMFDRGAGDGPRGKYAK